MIARAAAAARLKTALEKNPVCALLGPRQCGKSTLAQEFSDGRAVRWFDLEDSATAPRSANPNSPGPRCAGWLSSTKSNASPGSSPPCVHSPTDAAHPRVFLFSAAPPRPSCAASRQVLPVESASSTSADSTSPKWVRKPAMRSGCAEDFRAHFWRPPTPPAPAGEATSCAPFSSRICHSSESALPPRRSGASGR